jgi:hypothetical protein
MRELPNFFGRRRLHGHHTRREYRQTPGGGPYTLSDWKEIIKTPGRVAYLDGNEKWKVEITGKGQGGMISVRAVDNFTLGNGVQIIAGQYFMARKRALWSKPRTESVEDPK